MNCLNICLSFCNMLLNISVASTTGSQLIIVNITSILLKNKNYDNNLGNKSSPKYNSLKDEVNTTVGVSIIHFNAIIIIIIINNNNNNNNKNNNNNNNN